MSYTELYCRTWESKSIQGNKKWSEGKHWCLVTYTWSFWFHKGTVQKIKPSKMHISRVTGIFIFITSRPLEAEQSFPMLFHVEKHWLLPKQHGTQVLHRFYCVHSSFSKSDLKVTGNYIEQFLFLLHYSSYSGVDSMPSNYKANIFRRI